MNKFIIILCGLLMSAATITAYSQSGNAGNLRWNISGGRLIISGSGEMSYIADDREWKAYKNSIRTVVIENGVTSIADHAFGNLENMTSITIPNSVTSIGKYAFWECKSLVSVTIPSSIRTIENYTFARCESITTMVIPSSVITIGESAFSGCKNLVYVTIPNSVTSIGGSAFYDCQALTSITIPSSVRSVGKYVFLSCSRLTTLILGSESRTVSPSAASDTLIAWVESRGGSAGQPVAAGTQTTTTQNHVSNVRVQQSDEQLFVTYDLAATADVEAYISFDGGATYRGPLQHVSGSIGKEQTTGREKIFVWNAVREVGYVDIPNAVVKVVATTPAPVARPQPQQPVTPPPAPAQPQKKPRKDGLPRLYIGLSAGAREFGTMEIAVSERLYIDREWTTIDLVTISDLSGRILFRMTNFSDDSIDVSNLKTGVYILILKNNDEVIVKRFVKE